MGPMKLHESFKAGEEGRGVSQQEMGEEVRVSAAGGDHRESKESAGSC